MGREDAQPQKRRWREKAREWVYRYGPAEILGLAGAYAGSFLTYQLTDSEVAAAYGGAMGENVGFYGTMIAREAMHDYRQAGENYGKYRLRDALKMARNLFVEFGPAEYLDTAIIRPLAMGMGSTWLGRGAGVFAGKVVADISFYIPTIISYELRKKHLD